jgi:hypothetical protein
MVSVGLGRRHRAAVTLWMAGRWGWAAGWNLGSGIVEEVEVISSRSPRTFGLVRPLPSWEGCAMVL